MDLSHANVIFFNILNLVSVILRVSIIILTLAVASSSISSSSNVIVIIPSLALARSLIYAK